MIVITRNDRASVAQFDTFTEELKFFRDTIESYKVERPDYIKAVVQVRNHTACLRTYNTKTGREDREIIAIIDEIPTAHKKWRHINQMVKNRQGGETYINDWQLIS